MRSGIAYLLFVAFLIVAASSSKPAIALSRKAKLSAQNQTLFSCHVDRLALLRPFINVDSEQQTFTMSDQRTVDEEVQLMLNVQNKQITLFIRSEGGSTEAHVLRKVEQSNSLESGTGGHEQTAIQGKDGAHTFTLLAGYDTQSFEHNASLQIIGKKHFLLNCDSDPFKAPRVEGLERLGSTSIYSLHADGLAAELGQVPFEQEFLGRQ